ncbi:MAG: aromatic acid exporter family protein [Erysipelotrichaceae bacterium]
MLNFVGLRTIKTGIAVTIAIIISNLLNLEYPYFVAMTAIISMDKTALSSILMWRNRTFGTLLGATIGICFSYISRGNPLLCGIGFILAVTILNKLKMSGAVPVCGFVLCAVMVHTISSPLIYGFHRTLDTLIGGAISLVVNICIFPYYHSKSLHNELDALWDYTHDLIDKTTNETLSTQDTEKIKSMTYKFSNEFQIYTDEVFFKQRDQVAIKCQNHLKMLEKLALHLHSMIDAKDKNNTVYHYHQQEALSFYQRYLNSL